MAEHRFHVTLTDFETKFMPVQFPLPGHVFVANDGEIIGNDLVLPKLPPPRVA